MTQNPVLQKLSNILGPTEAPKFINATCASLGLHGLDHPQDRMRFACALIERGGLLEAIGRAIKVQAILHGAKEP
jgi:hypothetical protein